MGRRLDSLSDELLKEVNEDIHDLNESVKAMSASVEALQSETAKLYEQHFENLQKLYIELSENSRKDIEEETQVHLGRTAQKLDNEVQAILEKRISGFDERFRAIKDKADELAERDSKTPTHAKIIIVLLVLAVFATTTLGFVIGRGQEQARLEQFINTIPYLDPSQMNQGG